jgi:hypothetical protein
MERVLLIPRVIVVVERNDEVAILLQRHQIADVPAVI